MQSEEIEFVDYKDESFLPDIQRLAAQDLSEPYSVFTYRYFLHNWPQLCICVYAPIDGTGAREMIGTVVGKADEEYESVRGYIAMLAVSANYRKRGIGVSLVKKVIERMVGMGCDAVTLETELTNVKALNLYEKLGFMRTEKLGRYYLNGGDAYRLQFFVDADVVMRAEVEAAGAGESEQGAVH